MSALKGRKLELTWDHGGAGAITLRVRENSFELSGEGIDVSDSGTLRWREMLEDETDIETMSITVSGVVRDRALAADWFAGTRTKDCRIEDTVNGDTIDGKFLLASYSETGTYNDAVTFEATLQSVNAPTFTAGA